MTASPRITLITPSYQQGAYIEATLRSVLEQGYPNLEYIVMDGSSRDETLSILRRYDHQLSAWVSEPDGGQADAINKGLGRATGDIIGWLNSDDLLLPGALARIAAAFSDPSVNVVTGLRRIIAADGRWQRNVYSGQPESAIVRLWCNIAQETTFWRRSVMERIGLLDASYRFAMDYEYWQRMLAAGYQFTLIPAYLGALREHEAAKGSTLLEVRAAELARLYQQHGIARDEAEAWQQLDALRPHWRARQRLYKDFGHQRLSDDPRRFLQLERLLHTPMLGGAMLAIHRRYRQARGRYVE